MVHAAPSVTISNGIIVPCCSRNSLISERVGSGFNRALYATYISNLPLDSFTYDVAMHGDERGVFVEMLKTKDTGQFSFFTIHPGIVRGEHYHHTKSEKFLVITGKAKFGFRNIVTGETIEIITSGEKSTIVETIPGWAHNIKNIGDYEMAVMLWANEIFNQTKFHHLLVVEEQKLLGVVSDRDVLKALSPNIGTASEKMQDLATLNKRVHQIMSRDPICLKPTDRVKRVVETFDENKISCIPIVNDNWTPVGIVTWRDIIKAIRSKYT